VQGLPDVFQDLQRNGFAVDDDIANKVVAIPAGTDVVDAADHATHYVFKPLQIQEYLRPIADPLNLDVSATDAVDLATVLVFIPHHLGVMPLVPVKYSEGKPVQ